jgi:hypothetical protein
MQRLQTLLVLGFDFIESKKTTDALDEISDENN